MTEAEWLACTDPAPMLALLRGAASARKMRLFASTCVRRVWNLLEEGCRNAVEVSERYADGLAGRAELEAALEKVRTYREAIPSFEEPSYLHFLGSVDNVGYWRCWRPLEEAAAELALGLGPELEAGAVARRAAEVAGGIARADAWEAALVGEEGDEINFSARDSRGEAASQSTRDGEMCAQAALLRDVCGNPFRPAHLDPAWLTFNGGTVVRLAAAAYDERALPEGTLDVERLAILADALEENGCHNKEMLEHLREQGVVHVRGCWVLDLLLDKS
jgi:hypothetical protein